MKKWHLYSKFENGVSVGGKIQYVLIFGIIGLFILVLACINYMNLSTAKALNRAKEVGIRKTLGSSRKQLIYQFFTESFLLVVMSFVIAMGIAFLLLPWFNELTQKQIELPILDPIYWIICVAMIIATSILSSTYPSLFLSSFKPVKVLKGFKSKSEGAMLRRALVIVQFTISIILIIGTLIVVKQINFVKDRPVGYSKEMLVSIPIKTKKVRDGFETLKNKLLESPAISNVAASDVKITSTETTNGGFQWKGKDPNFNDNFYTLRSTHGFGEMVDWEIIEGRDFSKDFKGDSLSFLINETAVEYMGFENPIGQQVKWGNNGTFKIVGVVKDMVTRSPFDPVVPSIYTLHYGNFLSFVNIKVSGQASISEALDHARMIFSNYDPDNLFTYSFLDEEFQAKFDTEERVASLTSIFAFLAIAISCLGVFGLSTFMAIQRKKEIGIRKVLGASVNSIWRMLCSQFLVLVLISILIAMPIGYYYSDLWLDKFSYRTDIDFWVFLGAAVIVILSTIITVSFQSIKAAVANPIKSLRTE